MSQQSLKKCPRCWELAAQDATTCSGCRYEFEPQESEGAESSAPPPAKAPPGWLNLFRQRFRRQPLT
jgi:hypothetical protein